MGLTTDRNSPCLHETKEDGQNKCYLVLSDEELAKGFIRPLRDTYVHRGKKLETEGRIISLEEAYEGNEGAKKFYNEETGYAAYLEYPESMSPLAGKYLKKEELEAMKNQQEFVGGCGASTTMSSKLAETYARQPDFYGATFCTGCGTHLPVNEFVWQGTDEIVGS